MIVPLLEWYSSTMILLKLGFDFHTRSGVPHGQGRWPHMKIITPQHSDTLNVTTEKESLAVFQSNNTNFSSIGQGVAEIWPYEIYRSSKICRKGQKNHKVISP